MSPQPLLQIHEPGQRIPPRGFALWNLGFRPFYLLASVYGAASVLLWIFEFSGLLPAMQTLSTTSGSLRHGHEMLFGFTTAIIAGFLLTAVRAWTGQATASGKALMALAALWLAGRILVWLPFPALAALTNATFPLAVAVAIAIPLWRTQSQRNYFFVALLAVMGLLIATLHLAVHGWLVLPANFSLTLALDLVLFIMAVMGGRVIPMFTSNGVPGTQAERKAVIEKLALGSIILLFAADLLQVPMVFIALLTLTAAFAHALRLYFWQPWRTLKTPLVWILHIAYGWIVVHLLLRSLTAFEVISGSYAIHALTVGGIGSMTLGMMTRTARGHTGRPLLADRFEVAMFVLMQIAALSRVFTGIVWPALYLTGIHLAGLLWAVAYGLYAVRYWPVLSRPRLDGRPG